jgi:hypothetical protein
MAKSSPMIRAFNAGVFSALMEGRTDIDFYPASMRSAVNCILTPQGPVICRSGTLFDCPARTDDETSTLLPFIYNTEQAKALEFGSDRIRFINENGIQVYASVSTVVTATTPFQLTAVGLNGGIGDQVVLSGFPADYNLNGEILNIVNVAADVYTFDRNVSASVTAGGDVALVYHVDIDYTEDERQQLRVLQDVDILYLLCGTKRTKKLARYGDYDWRLTDVDFIDGPYLPDPQVGTTISISGTGNAIPVMTSNTLPSGTATGSSQRDAIAAAGTFLGRTYALGLPATDYFHAFDESDDTYWASETAQTGTLQYDPATPFVCTGYTIYAALQNDDVTYLNTDFAPSTWYFEGWNGAAWVVLDFQEDYVAYDNNRSVLFEIANTVAYSKYRLRTIAVVRNGQIEVRIRRLTLRSNVSLTLTASGVAGINGDRGFLITDVGRSIRLRGRDNYWRWLRITAHSSTTEVTAELMHGPFLTTDLIYEWRLGLWSDTTGWPSAGDFFGERMFLGPSNDSPNVLCGSVVGLYENFTHVEQDGVVLEDGAIVHYIKSPQLSRIKWIASNERGMIVGTGSQEFVIERSVASDRNLTPQNIKSNPSTRKGSTNADPVIVDNRILHVPRSGRSIREVAYSLESDGYVSNNMSRFASHLGVPGFVEQAYAAEPHTIDFVRRGDGTVVSLTYNRDEGVVGWGELDFAGAIVESILVIPQIDQQQDALWMQTRRTVNGVEKRYIEHMTRPWDFGMTLDDAVYTDCAIIYDGADTETVYGAQHLEGQQVYGLARSGAGTEESPYEYLTFGPKTVANGAVVLDAPANRVVLGLGFDSEGETARLENGAAEGTAQGKVKRIGSVGGIVWDSACGKIGAWDDFSKEFTYDDFTIVEDYSATERVELKTGMLDPQVLDAAYSKRGSIAFKRPKETPVPFNIVAILPRMMTYDS